MARNSGHRAVGGGRSLTTALVVAVIALLSLIAAAPLSPVATATPSAATSTFTAASVERADDGSYAITWSSDADSVQVSATTDPTGNGILLPVGTGGGTGSVIATGLDVAAPRWYFVLQADTGARLVTVDRSFHMEHANNLRDLGGYRTTDGHWTKPGLVLRSNKLSGLDQADWARLLAVGLDTDVDLRNRFELDEDPDAAPAGVRYSVQDVAGTVNPVFPDFSRCGVLATPGAMLNELVATSDLSDAPTAMGYPLMTCYGASNTAFTNTMRLIAQDSGTVLFHCTAGKDRTGWASAVLLGILGVPRATIMSDFLDSNRYRGANSVQREWLQIAFDHVDQLYGSFDNYVHRALRLDDATLARLRQRLLQ